MNGEVKFKDKLDQEKLSLTFFKSKKVTFESKGREGMDS